MIIVYKGQYGNSGNYTGCAANKNKPAIATVTFKGNYKSLKKMTKDFFIEQADISDEDMEAYAPDNPRAGALRL